MSRKRQSEGGGKPLTEAQIRWLTGEASIVLPCPFERGEAIKQAWFQHRELIMKRCKGKEPWPVAVYETDIMEREAKRMRAYVNRMEKKRQTE